MKKPMQTHTQNILGYNFEGPYPTQNLSGKIPVPEEVIKSVEKRIIKTKNPLSSIRNNKKQPS